MPAQSTFGSASVIPYTVNNDSYNVSKSLRFRSSSSTYLTKNLSLSGNRQTFTHSVWLKRGGITTASGNWFDPFSVTVAGNASYGLYFDTTDKIDCFLYYTGAAWEGRLTTNQVFRDPAAWYHILLSIDTTQATASERAKIFVNGQRITSFSTESYPNQNRQLFFNHPSYPHYFGQNNTGTFDGYMTEAYHVDGLALRPENFGYTDANTGVWTPKRYSGTYGTNGFYINFSNALSANNLGFDYSGNNNHMFPVNFSIINGETDDSCLDTPTNRGIEKEIELSQRSFIARANSNLTLSNNRLTFTGPDSVNHRIAITKVGLKNKKYYWEVTAGTDGNSVNIFGLAPLSASTADGVYVSSVVGCGWGYSTATGQYYTNGFAVSGSFPAITNGQVIGFAYDAVNQLLWIRNTSGWLSGDPNISNSPSFSANTGNIPLLAPAASIQNNTGVSTTFNFGPTYTFAKPDGFFDVFDVTTNPQGNYATLNPISPIRSTILDGNLRTNGGDRGSVSTIAMLSGKWYCEMTVTAVGAESSIGLSKGINVMNTYVGSTADSWGYYFNGTKYTNGGGATYATSYTTGDVIGCSFDADNGILSFYKNGSPLGSAFTGLTDGPYYFATSGRTSTAANDVSMNFGQKPFAFGFPLSAQPFKALCTTNLPTPSIKKSSIGFDAITYNGTGTTLISPSGLKFSPDLVWIKSRSQDISHVLSDTVRGVGEVLCTNNNRLSSSDSFITNFNQDGFTLNTSITANNSGSTYVAWCWDAGSETTTNNQGTITSTVRANPKTGFSIVSWTDDTSNNNRVGHGLGVAPKMVFYKARNYTENFYLWTTVIDGSNDYLLLNSAQIKTDVGAAYTSPTSTTISNWGTWGGAKLIAYCFAEVEGFSKFGTYVGNGSTDGTFVWCGFRPKLVLVKSTTAAEVWVIKDTSRSIFNGTDYELYPSSSAIEGSYSAPPVMDYVSNGFKLRSTASASNGATTILFAAFAESPFKYARAR